MGTITERRRKNGTITYFAQIMRRNGGKMYRESKTFERPQAARIWVEKREKELDRPGGLEVALTNNPTLAEAIDKYVLESKRAMGRTKTQVLRALKTFPIANMRCSDIKSHDIIELAQQLGHDKKKATVASYLSHLGAIFAVARPAWGIPLDQQAMKDAYVVAKRLGVTGKSKGRERRPTIEEITKILDHYGRKNKNYTEMIPMGDIVLFAIFSTRRLSEITRITWNDFEPNEKRVMVRDMKDPGEKVGNDTWCDVPVPAIKIAKRQKKIADEIFPYNSASISASFARTCLFLNIENLHFHDLRHEGVSRLIEMGMTIPHAAATSGHRSWASLKRYTHIRQSGDKWANLVKEIGAGTR